MKKEEEEKVQSMGSGVIGNWIRKTRQDAFPNFKALCLVVLINYAWLTRRDASVHAISTASSDS
jgi:hypothetical protein